MIKIKLAELYKHRNETTFRPYLMAKDLFRDIGITFVVEGSADLTWVAQASYNDRKDFYTYGQCLSRGLKYLDSIEEDFVLFDGQDSASLLGSFDILRNSAAKLLLKNTLYTDRGDYLEPWKMGRKYWGLGEPLLNPNEKRTESFGYAINKQDIGQLHRVKLTGCNWLSTIKPTWYDASTLKKDIDVFAMFSYPGKENWEFGCPTNLDYDAHRKRCIDELDKLPSSVKVSKLEDGKKVPIEEYYNLMSRSKIVIAPFGYGEMAPRDVEAAQFGAVLIKPEMFHIETLPYFYKTPKNFSSCEWDFSDLNTKIELILDSISKLGKMPNHIINERRQDFDEMYNPEKLVVHTYNWLSKLEGFETE